MNTPVEQLPDDLASALALLAEERARRVAAEAEAADLKSGSIVQLFPGWSLPSGGIHAVFPTARFRPAKVRTFLDMLVAAERRRENRLLG